MSNAGTELTVVERAQVALNYEKIKQEFTALAESSKSIIAITNAASYEECHVAHMRLVKARTNTEKTGKSVREDAQGFVKTELALEKELLGIIGPEETRLREIKQEHNTRVERERVAKAEAEAARLARIQGALADLSNGPGTLVGQPSAVIAAQLEEVRAHDVHSWCEEFGPQAEEAKAKAAASLELMLAGTLAHEEAARQAAEKAEAERQELARLRAEQQERDRTEQARIAEETRRRAEEAAAARAKIEAEERASRERIEAEERAARKVREEADRESAKRREHHEMLMQEIQAIRYQSIIARSGRLGVRAGGTIDCIRETLAETEAWVIDPEHFGPVLTAPALAAKNKTIAEIQDMLDYAVREAQDRDRREQEEKAWAEKQAQEQAKRAQEEAEARRQADAQAEQVAQQQAAEARRLRAEEEAITEQKREIALQQQELLATDRLIRVLRARLGTLPRYGQLAAAIDAYLGSQAPASKSQAKRKEAA